MEILKGKIKAFYKDKNYGLISYKWDNINFDAASVKGNIPQKDDEVSFILITDEFGMQKAVDVTVTKSYVPPVEAKASGEEVYHGDKGKVKIFFAEKGEGYINHNGEHIYFYVTDIQGDDLPDNGDEVGFTLEVNGEGKKIAKNIHLLDHRAKNKVNESLVKCPKCGKHVVPSVTSGYMRDTRSVCPLCGHAFKTLSYEMTIALVVAILVFLIWLGLKA